MTTLKTRNAAGFYETSAHGLTMMWKVFLPHRINRANPVTITGYVNGECRMEHGAAANTLDGYERAVILRLAKIASEAPNGKG